MSFQNRNALCSHFAPLLLCTLMTEKFSAFGTSAFTNNLQTIFMPILAILTAILVGSVFILASGYNPIDAYGGLLDGAFGSPRGWSRTILNMVPFIFAGLSVAFAFHGGLFNIGAEGQIFIGSICAATVGYMFAGLPAYIHLPLALATGALGGAVWGSIPGILKAFTGSHEVITTIMFNYIGIIFTGYLITGPLQAPDTIVPRTPDVLDSARLPLLTGANLDLHAGILLALFVAFIIYWLIWATPFGFEVRTIGLNPGAAAYAGMSVKRITVLTMTIAGLLAGLAGTVETLGRNYYFAPGFNVGYGFQSIVIALLAKNNPLGVILTAFLFGAMDAGATRMQRLSDVPSEIIQIVQGLILMFVAADQIIRAIYRLRAKSKDEGVTLSSSWGQS